MKLIKKILSQEGFVVFFRKVIFYLKQRVEQKCIEKLNKLIGLKKWNKSVTVGTLMVIMYPNNALIHQKLAICLDKIGDKKRATLIMKRALSLKFNKNINNIIQNIEKNLKLQNIIQSKYYYLGGYQNLGFIEHKQVINNEIKCYLTKISPKEVILKEKLFYKKIIVKYPGLKSIVPKVSNITDIETVGVCFITMKKVKGKPPKFSKENFTEFCRLYEHLKSVKYNDIVKLIPDQNLNKRFKYIPNNPIMTLHSIVSINKKATNNDIFKTINKLMKDYNYSPEALEIISRLKSIILEKKMYKYIELDSHYCLNHGDLKAENIIESDNRLFIIDWGNMRIGTTWGEIACFLGMLKVPWEKLMSNYLSNRQFNSQFTQIEKLFLIYTLIVTWFINFSREEFEETLSLYSLPAIEYMENLAESFAA